MADETRSFPPSNPTATGVGPELPTDLLAKLRLDVPGYQLLDELGSGGQATVYRARELTSGLTVAVKILHGHGQADPAARERFRRETAALKALNHPNIVCVIEAGRTPLGLDFLVMNYVDGRPLDAVWKDRAFAAAIAKEAGRPAGGGSSRLRLFKQICDVVQSAHRRGITHRDLSPSNILIDPQGQPHVLDFGLASTAFDALNAPGNVTLTGQFIGKLKYASPEQARGSRDPIDIRSDVYSLGVLLYQILTGGAFPYEVVGNVMDVLNNIIHSKPTLPSALLAGRQVVAKPARPTRNPPLVNATIEAIVLKALEKDPAGRYESAGALGDDIERYLVGRPTSASPEPARAVSSATPSRRWHNFCVWGSAAAVLLTTVTFMNARAIGSFLGLSVLFGMTADNEAAPPTSQPTADSRLVYLADKLAGVEASIAATNKGLLLAGYKSASLSDEVKAYDKGNEIMDRKGGAPVRWEAFYGKTVKAFSSRNVVGDRQEYRRPPQFDFIYKANNDRKAAVQKDIDGLGRKQDALFDYRRKLEGKQLALWSRIAWESALGRGSDANPLYRYQLKPASATQPAAGAHTKILQAAVQFAIAADNTLTDGLNTIDADPLAAITTVASRAKTAYSNFRGVIADTRAVGDLPPGDDAPVRAIDDNARHFSEILQNATDAFASATESDAARDDAAKAKSRADLQSAILDTSTTIYALDGQLSELANNWHVLPDTATRLAAYGTKARLADGATPAANSQGQTTNQTEPPVFAADELSKCTVAADGTITSSQEVRLDFQGTQNRDFVVSGEAYFDGAGDNDKSDSILFCFRETNALHRYNVESNGVRVKRVLLDGTKIDKIVQPIQFKTPHGKWVKFQFDFSAVRAVISLGNDSGTLHGPLNTDGLNGVVLRPGGKLRNVKVSTSQ